MLIINAQNPPNNNIEIVTQIMWLSGAAKSFSETANFSPKKGRKILLWIRDTALRIILHWKALYMMHGTKLQLTQQQSK